MLAFSTTPARADDDRGAALFGLCTQCHGSIGQGNELALAPAIAGLSEWYVLGQLQNFRSATRGTHPADVGGLRMHPMSRSIRSDADVEALAAFVANLPTAEPERTISGGDAARGAELYTTCGACHGADGEGNPVTNSPRLTGASDWYLLSSLQKYKAGIRGGNPQNANAVMMRGMAAQLVDDQAMKDVIAYIESLPATQ